MEGQPRIRTCVDFYSFKTLSNFERKELGLEANEWFRARPDTHEEYQPKLHLAWAISLYRMRVRMCQDIDALIVLGGKDVNSWGRFAGIAEEVMLALAMGKPVYLLGGRHGSAESVGNLMGLGETIANPDGCLHDPGPIGSTLFQFSHYQGMHCHKTSRSFVSGFKRGPFGPKRGPGMASILKKIESCFAHQSQATRIRFALIPF